MKKYYTTLQFLNNAYIGQVYDSNNNQLIFTTKPYNVQRQAIQEMDSFIDGTAVNEPITLNQITSETLPSATPRRRCCGR